MTKDGRIRTTEKFTPDRDDNLRQSEDDPRKRDRTEPVFVNLF
jgi:hypothetical protein